MGRGRKIKEHNKESKVSKEEIRKAVAKLTDKEREEILFAYFQAILFVAAILCFKIDWRVVREVIAEAVKTLRDSEIVKTIKGEKRQEIIKKLDDLYKKLIGEDN